MPTEMQVKWGRVMESIVGAAYYRTLGQNSLYAPPPEIFQYILDEVSGPIRFGGSVNWRLEPGLVGVLEWNNVALSPLGVAGPTVNLIVWGRMDGKNTVFTRRGWWKLYLVRGAMELRLNLPRGAFLTRLDVPLPGV